MRSLIKSVSIISLFIIFLISCDSDSNPTNSDGEPNVNTFIKTYGGSGIDYAMDVVSTNDGGYVFVGKSHSANSDFSNTGSFEQKIYAIKIDSEGNKVWINTFSGSGINRANTIISTSDGSFLISGMTSSNDGDFTGMNKGFRDRFLIKLSSTGVKEWIGVYGGNSTDWGERHTIDETPDGGFVMTGHTGSTDGDFENTNNDGSNLFLIKVDSNGQKNWVKIFKDEINGSGNSLNVSDNGEIVVTGFTVNSNGDRDAFLLKLNSIGEKEWVKKFGGSAHDNSLSVNIDDATGEILITGYSDSNDGDFEGINNGEYDVFTIKTNNSGEPIWINKFGGSRWDFGNDISITNDGNYVLTGYTESTDSDFNNEGNGSHDIFILKLSTAGEILWMNRFGGSEREEGYAVTQDPNNHYIIAGITSSNDGNFDNMNFGEADIFIVKLNENGELN